MKSASTDKAPIQRPPKAAAVGMYRFSSWIIDVSRWPLITIWAMQWVQFWDALMWTRWQTCSSSFMNQRCHKSPVVLSAAWQHPWQSCRRRQSRSCWRRHRSQAWMWCTGSRGSGLSEHWRGCLRKFKFKHHYLEQCSFLFWHKSQKYLPGGDR